MELLLATADAEDARQHLHHMRATHAAAAACLSTKGSSYYRSVEADFVRRANGESAAQEDPELIAFEEKLADSGFFDDCPTYLNHVRQRQLAA